MRFPRLRVSAQILLPFTLVAFAPNDTVIDSFDSVGSWVTNPSEGVDATIHADSGLHGRALRLDFDFHGRKGYAIVHRDLDLELPPNFKLSVALRGDSPANTLEIKLVDRDRKSVWWSNNPEFVFPREWQTVAREKREICFAWGEMPRTGYTRRLSAIEIAITAGSGGKGSVWLDDLTLTPLDLESPFAATAPVAATPLVGTWESAVPNPDGSGAKLDIGSDGSFRSVVGVMASFRYDVDNDKLTTDFGGPNEVKGYRFVNRFSISNDVLKQSGDNLLGRDLNMKRVGVAKGGVASILGVWAAADFTGSNEFVAFEDNGKAELRVPVQYCGGTWKEAAGHLSIMMNGQPAERDYSIANDTLTLRSDGRQIKYVRRTQR